MLVPNWKQALKWYSVQSMAVSAALVLSWGYIPDGLRQLVPESWGRWIVGSLLALGVTGRLVDQEAGIYAWFKSIVTPSPGQSQEKSGTDS